MSKLGEFFTVKRWRVSFETVNRDLSAGVVADGHFIYDDKCRADAIQAADDKLRSIGIRDGLIVWARPAFWWEV